MPITVDLLSSHFRIDAENGTILYKSRGGNWLPAGYIKPGSVGSGGGYRIVSVPLGNRNYKKVRAHILMWIWHYGMPPSGEIDHINGDRDDNRIANLRECTVAQNRTNRRISSTRTSGYKWCTQIGDGKWMAQIEMPKAMRGDGPRKMVFRKVYDTPDEAYAAACEFAQKLHGEFFNPGLSQ